MGTWGWPGVSFHGGPLQTQSHGQRLGPIGHRSPCICSSFLTSKSPRVLIGPSQSQSLWTHTVSSLAYPGTNGDSPAPAMWDPGSPAGIMTDKAVAEADLMTLPPVREGLFSTAGSPDSCWCRARRRTRSLVALGPEESPSFEGGQRSPGRARSAATEQVG